RDQGRGAHVLHQARVEGLALVLGVVRGELLGGGGALGEGDDVVALGLDAAEDLPAQAALDGVGLEQDECALCGHSTRVPTDPGRSGTAGGERDAGLPLSLPPLPARAAPPGGQAVGSCGPLVPSTSASTASFSRSSWWPLNTL